MEGRSPTLAETCLELNFSRTVEATTEFNSNIARAWAKSYSAVQQQFATREQ
jgi:hypothetical protein